MQLYQASDNITELEHKNTQLNYLDWSAYQAKKYKALTQPYYRMLSPNGEDISNGSADYQHHNNASDFLIWLQEGLNINKEQK